MTLALWAFGPPALLVTVAVVCELRRRRRAEREAWLAWFHDVEVLRDRSGY